MDYMRRPPWLFAAILLVIIVAGCAAHSPLPAPDSSPTQYSMTYPVMASATTPAITQSSTISEVYSPPTASPPAQVVETALQFKLWIYDTYTSVMTLRYTPADLIPNQTDYIGQLDITITAHRQFEPTLVQSFTLKIECNPGYLVTEETVAGLVHFEHWNFDNFTDIRINTCVNESYEYDLPEDYYFLLYGNSEYYRSYQLERLVTYHKSGYKDYDFQLDNENKNVYISEHEYAIGGYDEWEQYSWYAYENFAFVLEKQVHVSHTPHFVEDPAYLIDYYTVSTTVIEREMHETRTEVIEYVTKP